MSVTSGRGRVASTPEVLRACLRSADATAPAATGAEAEQQGADTPARKAG